MDKLTTLAERIRFAREKVMRMTQAEVAERLDLKRGAIGNWELGKGVSRSNLRAFAALADVSLDWLENGVGVAPRASPLTRSFDPDAGPAIEPDESRAVSTEGRRNVSQSGIAEYDLLAGAAYGGGYALPSSVNGGDGNTYAADLVRAEWGVPSNWLRDEMRLSYTTTDILPIDGPSMIPDLMPGDRVFVDRRSRDPKNEGIYVVRDGDSIIVKHVQLVRDSGPTRIVCRSSNPNYAAFELLLDGHDVAIIGRVAARLSRM